MNLILLSSTLGVLASNDKENFINRQQQLEEAADGFPSLARLFDDNQPQDNKAIIAITSSYLSYGDHRQPRNEVDLDDLRQVGPSFQEAIDDNGSVFKRRPAGLMVTGTHHPETHGFYIRRPVTVTPPPVLSARGRGPNWIQTASLVRNRTIPRAEVTMEQRTYPNRYSVRGGSQWWYEKVTEPFDDMMCIYYDNSMGHWYNEKMTAGGGGIVYHSTGFRNPTRPPQRGWRSIFWVNPGGNNNIRVNLVGN